MWANPQPQGARNPVVPQASTHKYNFLSYIALLQECSGAHLLVRQRFALTSERGLNNNSAPRLIIGNCSDIGARFAPPSRLNEV